MKNCTYAPLSQARIVLRIFVRMSAQMLTMQTRFLHSHWLCGLSISVVNNYMDTVHSVGVVIDYADVVSANSTTTLT